MEWVYIIVTLFQAAIWGKIFYSVINEEVFNPKKTVGV